MTIRPFAALARIAVAAGALLALSAPTLAQEHEFAAQLTELAQGKLQEIARNATIVEAVKAQNALTADHDAARIEQLDSQWRAETGAASKPMIDEVLASAASEYLRKEQDACEGLFTEIFVMDAKGLNVAQSTITSDYWQGDEEKFTLSFGVGPDAVHFGEIEEDESTQTFQSQVSFTLVDPESGQPIGALTAGVDLSML